MSLIGLLSKNIVIIISIHSTDQHDHMKINAISIDRILNEFNKPFHCTN